MPNRLTGQQDYNTSMCGFSGHTNWETEGLQLLRQDGKTKHCHVTKITKKIDPKPACYHQFKNQGDAMRT